MSTAMSGMHYSIDRKQQPLFLTAKSYAAVQSKQQLILSPNLRSPHMPPHSNAGQKPPSLSFDPTASVFSLLP